MSSLALFRIVGTTVLVLSGGLVFAQGRIPLSEDELAVLEHGNRNEADCGSRLLGPRMDFHFRYTGGARFWVDGEALGFSKPAEKNDEISQRRTLKIVARIVPIGSSEDPSYLRRHLNVDRNLIQHGRVGLSLQFHLGPGKYRLDWMLETVTGRICSGNLRPHAPTRHPGSIRPALAPGQSYFDGQSGPTPWWYRRRNSRGFHLKLILNIPPFKDSRPLTRADLSRIEAILSWLAFHPRVGRVSLVVFNLKDQKILFRQGEDVNFPNAVDLLQAIRSLSNNQVRLETLEKDSESRFLNRLLIEELSSTEAYDAVVFLGPRSPLDLDVRELASEIRNAAPVFYLKYRFFEAGARWSDPLQRITRELGGKMFPIQHPKDLWDSVEELMGLLGKN